MIITIYKVTHAPDCPRLFLPEDAMNVVRAPDTLTRCNRWPANPVVAEIANLGHISPNQFYFVNDSILVHPESMLLEYEDVRWVLSSNSTVGRIVAGGMNFELLDILEALPPDHLRGAPCLVDKHYSPIFRIERDPLGIYCSSGHLPAVDELFGAYHHRKLRGLVFEPIWSGEV